MYAHFDVNAIVQRSESTKSKTFSYMLLSEIQFIIFKSFGIKNVILFQYIFQKSSIALCSRCINDPNIFDHFNLLFIFIFYLILRFYTKYIFQFIIITSSLIINYYQQLQSHH